ncbi:MAG: tetratricopeptide repeat protein [Caldisericaceae bacterium]
MSAIFGKKDYYATLSALVDSSDFNGALAEAIKIGDRAYELGKVDETINIFENLLDIYNSHSMNNVAILVKVYEKLSPLYFEVNNVKKGVDATLSVVKNKIALNEVPEAVQILKILEVQFQSNLALMKTIVEIYVNLGFFSNALNLLEKIIQNQSKPDAEILTKGGEVALKLGRLQDALGYFNAVLIVNPADENARAKVIEINQNINATKAETAEIPKTNDEHPEGILSHKVEDTGNAKTDLSKDTLLLKEPAAEDVTAVQAVEPDNPVKAVENREQSDTNSREPPSYGNRFKNNTLYVQALEEIRIGELDQGINILLGLAQTYEQRDVDSAEFLYNKVLLLDPANLKVLFRLAEIHKLSRDTNEAVYYLRVAARNSSGEEKLSVLKELLPLVPNDVNMITETFEAYTQLKKIDNAIAILDRVSDKSVLESLATRLIPHLREDSAMLVKVARILKKRNISGDTYYQYAYLSYKSLFAGGDQVEAIKWFISASSLRRLPLDDYVEVGNYIKDMPLDDEKSIVAEGIFGYLDTISDVNKKSSLVELAIALRPAKANYIAKYLSILLELHNYKDASVVLTKLVNSNSLGYASLVYDAFTQLSDSLDIQSTLKIAQYLELADKKEEASSLYNSILLKDPQNETALIKSLIGKVESESMQDLLDLMREVKPSHSYEAFLEPIIENYKNEQSKTPFDYHLHFVLGFIYFFTERYEEAIASFQFVVRSHHYESFMHLLLGISFEKILLEDFASKQYEIGLTLEKEPTTVRAALLYNLALLKKTQGALGEARRYLEEIVKSHLEYKDAKAVLEGFGNADKIIGINEEDAK